MTLLYADASAIARAYFQDERDHQDLRSLLLESGERVVTSELARVEVTRALHVAGRSGRLERWRETLRAMDSDFGSAGPIGPIRLRHEVIEPACQLVRSYRLRTLDAIHLAVALQDCPALADGEEIVFVTRDEEQAAAASALGLTVA